MYYFININIFYYCIFLYVYMRIINIPKGKAMIHIRMQAYFLHMMHIYIYINKAHVFSFLIDSLKADSYRIYIENSFFRKLNLNG